MKITEEAKNVLNQVLAENNADGLLVTLQETCCGKNPVFQMAVFDENNPVDEIDGIRVCAGEDEKSVIEDMMIDLVNGELVVLNTVCGCGDGCHHDHEHDGECCSSHEHDGECCGNHESESGCCSNHGNEGHGGCCHHE